MKKPVPPNPKKTKMRMGAPVAKAAAGGKIIKKAETGNKSPIGPRPHGIGGMKERDFMITGRKATPSMGGIGGMKQRDFMTQRRTPKFAEGGVATMEYRPASMPAPASPGSATRAMPRGGGVTTLPKMGNGRRLPGTPGVSGGQTAVGRPRPTAPRATMPGGAAPRTGGGGATYNGLGVSAMRRGGKVPPKGKC